jgi:hypothetical protein
MSQGTFNVMSVWVIYAYIGVGLASVLLLFSLIERLIRSRWVEGVGQVKAVAVRTRPFVSIFRRHVVIEYELNCEGTRFNGDEAILLPEEISAQDTTAASIRSQFSVGSSVVVYYDPHIPRMNALRRHSSHLTITITLFLISLLCLAVAKGVYYANASIP